MKKLIAMFALTFVFTAAAGSASTKKDLPWPSCSPCSK